MADRPKIHVLVMGETGSGKSTFAATWPKPMLVWFFDPMGKDLPYAKQLYGEKQLPQVGELAQGGYGLMRDIKHEDGPVRVEYYHSPSPYQPDAYSRFLARMGVFDAELKQGWWKTVVLDSTTFMELEGRKWHQYGLNPSAKDPRQWYGGSKELLEEMLMMRFAGLAINVVVLCHIDDDRDEMHGEIVRNPAVPGKLSKRLPSAFGEHYRMFVMRDEKGQLVHLVQTRNNGQYAAQSQIGAPDPAYPHYEALWGK